MKKILLSFLALGLVLNAGAQSQKAVKSDDLKTEYSSTKKADKKIHKSNKGKLQFKDTKPVFKKSDKNAVVRKVNTSKAQPVNKARKDPGVPMQDAIRNDFNQ